MKNYVNLFSTRTSESIFPLLHLGPSLQWPLRTFLGVGHSQDPLFLKEAQFFNHPKLVKTKHKSASTEAATRLAPSANLPTSNPHKTMRLIFETLSPSTSLPFSRTEPFLNRRK